MRRSRTSQLLLGLCALLAAVFAAGAWAQPAPESSSGSSPKEPAVGNRFMVVAAHPLAVNAGYDVLKKGGTAIDAAVAMQFVLGLVEPQSSGIGGGAFILHYSAGERRLRAYDGRETAPAAAKPERFLAPSGRPLEFFEALLSGKSVGVPGLVAVLELAHRNHGRTPWRELVQPGIDLAEHGFALSPRLYKLLKGDRYLSRDPFAGRYLYESDGHPKRIGTILRNPEYAAVLKDIGSKGASAFYREELARDIVAAVQRHPVDRGDLTVVDFERYRAKEREPVCGPFREYRVCGMPPPSGGGIAVLQILGVLARLPRTDLAGSPVTAVHFFAEAGRLAYADRNRYVGDPDFVHVPVAGLIAPDYLARRAAEVSASRSLGRAQPGRPRGTETAAAAEDRTLELEATTHLSVVDAEGNAVALTASIEFAFGNHRFVHGFLLNNQLTDFAFESDDESARPANRVEGGKRPRSSMSPTMVFDRDGRLVMVAGSPGGHAIINYIARVLLGVLEWEMTLQAALEAPHFGSRNGPTELERGTIVEQLGPHLRMLGHEVRAREMTSGVHAIQRVGASWIGAADPRREGTARGD